MVYQLRRPHLLRLWPEEQQPRRSFLYLLDTEWSSSHSGRENKCLSAALSPNIPAFIGPSEGAATTSQCGMDDIFWVLAFTVPLLAILLVLCIDCQDPELDTPSVDDYQYKPSTSARSKTFNIRRPPSPPWPAVSSQPDVWRCPPCSISYPVPSYKVERDNESIPSYENQGEVQAGATDDEDNDDNYVPPYIDVLPDAPLTDQGNEDGASTDSLGGQYENVLECERNSPGEYVNVLEPEATILGPCFVGSGTSDRESEDDTPDYENV
ncbi:linker for activation of T-cells family member 1 isoform X2 [Zootoca vivipara]|uniref:linker for activation of T-cells family member 1 isoform X2 n=1 Tax=Zootoca vivipara TaxID=8524 RepID=UPI001591AB9B|nr:linker for activation of T-cells family member 1 isoform X2 [Zootoca vivipara]